MKRFVDVRGQHIGERFAWWDTCQDKFESFRGEYAFETWSDFVAVYDGNDIDRYRGLCPSWVFSSAKDEDDDIGMIRGILNKIKIVLAHNKPSEMIGFEGLFEAYEQLEDGWG